MTDDTPPRSTLAEIARATGLSVPTVSKVLNGRPGVSPASRRLVEETLHRRGYVRRRRRLDPGPRLIDLVQSGLDGSWPASVTSAVEAEAHEAGLHVVASVAREASRGARPRRDWVDTVVERGTAGVIAGLVDLSDSHYARLRRAGVPVVLLHPLRDPPAGVASVGANTWAGAYDATEHLIGLGHRRIGLVTGPKRQLSEQARIAGFGSAMAAAGLAVPDDCVRHGTYDRASGRRLVASLLELDRRRRPTALLVCSDHMAIGGYEALAAAGLSVPDDVSVVGFDDLPEARWVAPALTTVRQPLKDMGRAAVQLLVRLMAGEEVTSRRVEFATSLVVRDSTARARPARSR
ncbi:MAG TPA: LacI family DNA-binding transcriptional regulator [Acidimicrobiales bacterium]|nr:LacI family DNA-binding transcriptional regulator [Acidimicrobiales bacterium]